MSKVPIAEFTADGEDKWVRELKGFLFALEDAGDGEWWLTMVCDEAAPRMEFSGSLMACQSLYASLHALVRSGSIGPDTGRRT